MCGRPLGPGDYLKIAEAFHTILLAGIPVLPAAERNRVRRLINLIDTLYDRRIRLIASAATEPDKLWEGTEGTETVDFARTGSRLTEMRSDSYWDAATSALQKKKTARAEWPEPSKGK